MSLPSRDLIDNLEQAFIQGTPDRREAALWYATDALLSGRYSEDQIWLFGEIIDRLAAELELEARKRLAHLLCQSNNAPFQTIKKLAFDDAITVAGPVLSKSERLNEQDLVEVANFKSQQHLFAITQRKSITEPITDVLVIRGDEHVVRATAENSGARFSETGFFELVKRSENDSILAEVVGMRKDIPRHQFLQLIARAAAEVQKRLAAVAPAAKAEIHHAVADAAGAIQAKFGPGSKEYFEAKRRVFELSRSGELNEGKLHAFASAHQFDEAIVALSLLCKVPPDVTERALIDHTAEMVLILSKSAGFAWTTVQSLLVMRAGRNGMSRHDMDAAMQKYSRLTVTASQKVLDFYETRRRRSKSGIAAPPSTATQQ